MSNLFIFNPHSSVYFRSPPLIYSVIHAIGAIKKGIFLSRDLGPIIIPLDGFYHRFIIKVHGFYHYKQSQSFCRFFFQAEPLVLTLRDLFQTMVELKQERDREAAKNKANDKTSGNEIKEENKKVGNHQLKFYSTLTYLPTKLLLAYWVRFMFVF